jgi:hypothetical protein
LGKHDNECDPVPFSGRGWRELKTPSILVVGVTSPLHSFD